MTREFFDPPWEQTDVVIVDQKTLARARAMLSGCEACSEGAELPFDHVLDRIMGKNPAVTDYIMEAPIRCHFCGREIREKTLVEVRD